MFANTVRRYGTTLISAFVFCFAATALVIPFAPSLRLSVYLPVGTAAGLALCALGFLLIEFQPMKRVAAVCGWMASIIGVSACVLGLASLIQGFLPDRISSFIAFLLEPDSPEFKMSAAAIAALTALGLSLAIENKLRQKAPIIPNAIAFTVLILGLFSMIAHFNGVDPRSESSRPFTMSFHGAIGFSGIALIQLIRGLKKNRYLPVIGVAIVGLAISFQFYLNLARDERHVIRNHFALQSQERVSAFEKELLTSLNLVAALRAFYDGSNKVERHEFRQFTNALLQDRGGVHSLQWIPHVAYWERQAYEIDAQRSGEPNFFVAENDRNGARKEAGSRPVHFPVFFAEPHELQDGFLGFDFASLPRVRAALNRARDTGRTIATTRGELPGLAQDHLAFLTFEPVFRKDSDENKYQDIGWRRENLMGFVGGIFDLREVLHEGIRQLGPAPLEIYVYDLSAPKGRQFLFGQTADAKRSDLVQPFTENEVENVKKAHYLEMLDIEGRQWLLLCLPSAGVYNERSSWIPEISFAMGGLITLLLSVYLFLVFRSRSTLQRLNEDLEQEISERKRVEDELSEKRNQEKILFNSVPAMIWYKDADNRILRANKSAAASLGLSVSDVEGKSTYDLYPEDAAKYHRDDLEVINSGKPKLGIVEKMVTASGERRWVQTDKMPYLDDEGNLLGVIVFAQDITERIEAEEIKASEERYRGVVQRAVDALFLIQKSGHFADVNQQACDILGYEREELERLSIAEVDGDYDPLKFHEFWRDLKPGKPALLETRLKKKDGTFVPVEMRAGLIVLRGEEFLLTIARDITERILADEKLREMSLAMQNALEGIARLDPNGRYLSINRSFATLLGYETRELVGRDWLESVHAEDRARAMAACTRMLTAGKGEFEGRGVRQDGSIFNMQGVIVKAVDLRGVFSGFYYFIKDITDQKYLESVEIKSQFISMVSHELRTPLHSIKEGVSVVLDGVVGSINEEQREMLNISKRNVDRLVRLINNVLDFQKFEAGVMQFYRDVNDVNVMIREAQLTVDPLVKGKGLVIDYSLGQNLPPVRFDKDRIFQVLINLIHNAVKFTDAGKIKVSSELDDRGVKISVSDTGIGLKSDDIPRLFKSFGQLEDGKQKAPGGTGLGLVISKKIIEQHGGVIWAEGEYGKGSVFSFVLPPATVEDVEANPGAPIARGA